MPGASPSRASRWRARPARPRCAPITKAEQRQRHHQECAPGLEAARPCACSSALRRSQQPQYACACIIEHGVATAIRRCQMARDVLLFAQQRDPLGMPTAYPVQRRACAEQRSAPARRAADGDSSLCRRQAHAVASPTSCCEVNWGLVLLITHDRLRRLRHALFGGGRRISSPGPLHADRAISPWAVVLLVAAAVIDIRVWMSLAYPAYGVALLLLVAVVVAGHVGLGAQRWITLGPLELQPSELMKISLVLALARFLHGKSVEEVSKPLPLADRAGDDRHSGRVRGAAAQSRHHAHHRRWTAARCCSWRACPGGGSRRRSAAVAAAVPLAWRFVLHDYQKARVMTFLDPESDALGAGWNITQAKIAIGSGGVVGQGLPAGHPEPAQLPARKADRFHLHQFRRGVRLCRLDGAADPVRGGDLLWRADRDERAQPVRPAAGHGHHPQLLLLHHDQRR